MPDLRDQLQLTLGAAYTLDRELGGGGMSRVFVAEDTRLRRKVVVKVPDLSGGVNVDRFMREIELAATLQHPCIVPVLSAGEMGGLPYYTMPLISGRTLRQRLDDRDLTDVEALKILRDIASALDAAHERGVVHRDVKPENVLISGDYALVTDFGIAKALAAAGGRAATASDLSVGGLTAVGMVLGTPAYMAPEQIGADPSIDHRADLYSWGVLAYEVFTGAPPFANRSWPGLMVAHMIEAPIALRERAPRVHETLAALVMQCLEKDPAKRPQTARELTTAIDTIQSGPVITAPLNMPSVAVLPFANMSNDPDNEYFSDGITDEIIGTLAKTRTLRVIARGSSFALKGKDIDLRTVGRQLGVETVVEGSVRRAGNRVRISAELVNVSDGFQLWSERFDRELTDVFQVQEEIANAIAGALTRQLSAAARTSIAMAAVTSAETVYTGASHPTPRVLNGQAYELYLKGLHFIRNQIVGGGLMKGIELLEASVAIDPRFAPAYSALGSAYYSLAVYAVKPSREVSAKAVEALRMAIALDPSLGEPLALLGYVRFMYEWDWDGARAQIDQALTLSPNEPFVMHRAAFFNMSLGRIDAAFRLMDRMLELDPMSAYAHYIAGILYVTAGRYERAITVLENGLRLNSQHPESMRSLGHAYVKVGRVEDAVLILERAAAMSHRHPWVVADLLQALLVTNRAAAEACRDELLERAKTEIVQSFVIGRAFMHLGDLDTAFRYFEQAVDNREFWMAMWAVDSLWDSIRADPRFEAVRARIGIPRE